LSPDPLPADQDKNDLFIILNDHKKNGVFWKLTTIPYMVYQKNLGKKELTPPRLKARHDWGVKVDLRQTSAAQQDNQVDYPYTTKLIYLNHKFKLLGSYHKGHIFNYAP
tara:strand:+ start:2089 stop:2415 length:327 start_codon:yes stop_codon:yes gene_type:complete